MAISLHRGISILSEKSFYCCQQNQKYFVVVATVLSAVQLYQKLILLGRAEGMLQNIINIGLNFYTALALVTLASLLAWSTIGNSLLVYSPGFATTGALGPHPEKICRGTYL